MSMWKQLFSEAPPGAMENLLSPKRKFWYAMFALTPGTVLGLFLNSVKNDMERENEALRLQHIQEELQVETDREQKDELLMGMIQELRGRLQSLEHEVSEKNALLLQAKQADDKKSSASNTNTVSASAGTTSSVETQAPGATADWEKKKDAFLTSSAAVAAATASGLEAQSGINVRVKQRERDVLQKDVRAYKAAAAAAAKDKPNNQ